MSGILGAMWKASAAAAAVTVVGGAATSISEGSCTASYDGDSSCSSSVASESVLLQRSTGRSSEVSKHLAGDEDTPMVIDESGFQGGEIDGIVDTGCVSADVRRRRRADTMCSCRRRDSGKRYDGGFVCQNDKMVKEAPKYTMPIWAEEFDDERGDGSLNESRWEIKYTGSGNGNNEKQFYTKRLDNLRIEDGVLKIIGKRENFEWKKYTSGKIQTKNMGDWGPGVRVEVRAKLPDGVGTWPAIWMMPTEWNYGGWPDSGEIDIMEAVGRSRGKVFGTIHTGAYNHMRGTQKGKSFYTDYTEWHTYALDWYPDRLEWFADGNLYNTFKPGNVYDSAKWPFNRRFYLILNLALGGNLGGNINFGGDQVMEIDYARVFCLDGSMSCKTEKYSCCSKCPGQYCSPMSGSCYGEKKKDYYETCEGTRGPEVVVGPPAGAAACCGSCGGKGYCSPRSNTCYASKKKNYYEACYEGLAPCCSSCGGVGFCSPQSGNCYTEKSKDYYETCGNSSAPEPATPPESAPACCASCGDKYCSPRSGSCYDWKKKDYYERCFTGNAACCSGCGGSGFCSPQSGNCYTEKKKDYYESCSA